MKKWHISLFVFVISSVLLTGCFNFGGTDLTNIIMKKGNIKLTMDFSVLSETISTVKIIATNPLYDSRTQDLVIVGKTALGEIENLEEGMWHIRAEVYDDLMNLIYSGENDVTIMPGLTVKVKFEFEPNLTPDTTGDLIIEVVINDFPDHVLIPHNVQEIHQNSTGNTFYIMDGDNKLITSYESAGYMKVMDYKLSEYPTCMTVSTDDSRIFVGFGTGHVGAIDTATGDLQILANGLGNIADIVLAGNYLVIRSIDDVEERFSTVDSMTGFVTGITFSPFTGLVGKMSYNPFSSKVYFTVDSPVDPISIYSLPVDPTGMLGAFHSTLLSPEDFGGPVRFIWGDSMLVTASGNLYQCAADEMNDLLPAGNIGGYQYWDMVLDPMSDVMYLINRYDELAYNPADVKLNTLGQHNHYLWGSFQLEGNPKRIFLNHDGSPTVIVEKDGQWYFRKVIF